MEADMSLWGLFLQAGLFVKSIMILLIVVSLISWTIIFYRAQYLRQAQRMHAQFEEQFWSGVDLAKLYEHLNARPKLLNGLAAIFHSGFREFMRLRERQVGSEIITESCTRAMRIALSREEDKLETHLSFLATVGSYSPYVGLLGTVWGIMNSFMALGAVQQATLSMVAPGIAEALIATALGLLAAIPAVIAYSRFNQVISRLSRQYENFCDELTGILQRQALGKVGS
jgi:biopolymer transport protein TolQ